MWGEGAAKKSGKKPRVEMYFHSNKFGGAWSIRNFPCDNQSFVLSCASDGSARGGLSSVLVYSRGRGVHQFGRIHSVGATLPAAVSPSAAPLRPSLPSCSIVVDPEMKLVTHEQSLNDHIRSNAVALHCCAAADCALTLANSVNGDVHPGTRSRFLLAYGGAAGLLRVHVANLLDLVLSIP